MKLYKFLALFNCIFFVGTKLHPANKFCLLSTIASQPEISVLYECSFRQIYCSHDLKRLWPTHEYTIDLCSRTYVKTHYREREASSEELSEVTSFKPIKTGQMPRLLVDQYLDSIPFIFKVKDLDQVHKIISYLRHEFCRYSIISMDVTLAISMDYGWDQEEKSILESLNADDAAFLDKYFNVLSPGKVKAIFEVYYKMLTQFDSIKAHGSNGAGFYFYMKKLSDEVCKFIVDSGLSGILKTFVILKTLHFLNKFGPRINLADLMSKLHLPGEIKGLNFDDPHNVDDLDIPPPIQ